MTRKSYRPIGCVALACLLAGCASTQTAREAQVPAQATAPSAPAEPQPLASAAKAAPPSPHEQRVQQLIRQVESAYRRGQAAYRRGQLHQAKVEFDRAVDMMLTSGIDIKADPKLHAEFERVVDAVNDLEMDALKEGNGFAPKEEPSPSDVANEVTFAVDPNFVARARTDLATTKSDLPLVVNDYVAAFIKFFSNTQRGHNTLLHSFQRAGRYRPMIKRILAEEGVPQDLIYLAVAESGFQPRALNRRSHAGGMWQFMPRGNYGLTRNRFVDERFDPEKSTRAYARYMKFLYNQLGDWYLAMAAYDWGAGNVQRAVQKTGYADFWELYKRNNLPSETKNYVPEILAAIIIANHPRQYGFDDITLDPPVVTDTVSINYSVNLRLAADLVGASESEIKALNPSLLRVVTPPRTEFDLHLPAGTAALFQQRIAMIPKSKRDAWRYHRVTSSDTLASVAHHFHVTVASLAKANQLETKDGLSGVEALAVPVAASRAYLNSSRYRIRRGDTLISIADRFGVSLRDLRRWNHIRGSAIRAGHYLNVTEPARTSSRRRGASGPATGPGVYRVRRGDTLSGIASRNGVSVDALRRWNDIRGSAIRAGQRLYVADPARVAKASTSRASSSSRNATRASSSSTGTRVYIVRRGDALITIAERFSVSVDDLRQWNHIRGSAIRAGQRLYVVDPTRAASASKSSTASTSRKTTSASKSPVKTRRYTIRRGDTLSDIADRFDVSVNELRRWNHIRGSAIRAGHRLYVAKP